MQYLILGASADPFLLPTCAARRGAGHQRGLSGMARRSRTFRPALRPGRPEGQQPPGGGDRRRVGGRAPSRLESRFLASADKAGPTLVVRHGSRGEVVVVPRTPHHGPPPKRRRPTRTGLRIGEPLQRPREARVAMTDTRVTRPDDAGERPPPPTEARPPTGERVSVAGRPRRSGSATAPRPTASRRPGPGTARHPASGQRLPPAGTRLRSTPPAPAPSTRPAATRRRARVHQRRGAGCSWWLRPSRPLFSSLFCCG